jgi:hypothetical protein
MSEFDETDGGEPLNLDEVIGAEEEEMEDADEAAEEEEEV